MGIVNLTPDSFYAPSRADGADAALARIALLQKRGCGIIDLGAVSTRPGADEVALEEEWRRLEPVLNRIAGLSAREKIIISIDTTSSEIVRRCCRAVGPFIVNDISAGEEDPLMLPTVAEFGLSYIAMHKRGNPRSMDSFCEYPEGVVKAVDDYFEAFSVRAAEFGIADWILDPGFGFAKTAEQNWELLENLPSLRHFGRPILVGVADKRFTRTPNPFAGLDSHPVSGSGYAEHLAEERGADILRIH